MSEEKEMKPLFSIKEIAGVRGYNLDAYLVALEGWRRGLKLKWYYDFSPYSNLMQTGFNPVGKCFSLSSDKKTYYFFRSRGEKVANPAVDICSNKGLTKEYLDKNKVPFPKGKRFSGEVSDNEIIEYIKELGFPLVIKPTFGSLGRGVITNISNEGDFLKNLKYLRSELGYKDIIVERYLVGEDCRTYVIDNKVVAAIKRTPANVIGDGINNIEKLIELKNEMRKKNPHSATRLIKVNDETLNFISNIGYTIKDIPKKDEIVYLNGKSNIASGGDSIDITDHLPTEVKKVSIDAVKAIPGLGHAGIDIIYDEDEVNIIEINPTAGISFHIFPMKGVGRSIPKAIIDSYFPETKERKTNNIYFDYRPINKLLRDKTVSEIEIIQPPVGTIYAKRYIVSGKVQGVGYRNWVKKLALSYDLTGYVKNLNNGRVVVVAASKELETLDKFKMECFKGPESSGVVNIKEFLWENALEVGFEIKRETKEDERKTKDEIQKLKVTLQEEKQNKQKVEERNKDLISKVDTLEQKYTYVTNSRSWKITAPLRNFMNKSKKSSSNL